MDSVVQSDVRILKMKDKNGRTALHYAVGNASTRTSASTNTASVMTALIAAGADVNARTNHGRSIFYDAVMIYNRLDVIEVLLSASSLNLIDQDSERRGVWHLIALAGASKHHGRHENHYCALTTLMRRAGADVNMKDIQGRTPLHLAVNGTYESFLLNSYLPMSDVRVNEQDNNGQTALHYAAIKDSANAVRYLLEHGADKSIVDNAGHAAVHYAKDKSMQRHLSVSKRGAEGEVEEGRPGKVRRK